MRMARPRPASSIAAAFAPRRRRGGSSSRSIRLGTFLHLIKFVLRSASRRRAQGCDIAARLGRRNESERQCNRDGGALAQRALHANLATVKRDKAFHDRQPEAGALVPPLIGLAGLEKR